MSVEEFSKKYLVDEPSSSTTTSTTSINGTTLLFI